MSGDEMRLWAVQTFNALMLGVVCAAALLVAGLAITLACRWVFDQTIGAKRLRAQRELQKQNDRRFYAALKDMR